MRLQRELRQGWGSEDADGKTLATRCEEEADLLLGVGQGSRVEDLRARTWAKESPCGFDITALGRVEYLAC